MRNIAVPYSVNSHYGSSPPKSKPATGQQTNGVCPPVHHVTSRYVNVFVHSLSQSSFIFHTHTTVWGIVCNNEGQRLTTTIRLSPRQSQLLTLRESQVGSCWLTRCDMSLCLLSIMTLWRSINWGLHNITKRIHSLKRRVTALTLLLNTHLKSSLGPRKQCIRLAGTRLNTRTMLSVTLLVVFLSLRQKIPKHLSLNLINAMVASFDVHAGSRISHSCILFDIRQHARI